MEKTEKLVYKPGVTLEGIYKAYSPRFGFLITDDDHEDVYIGEDNHLNAVNNDKVEVKTSKGETGRHNTEGRITRVIERANDTFVCTYEMLKRSIWSLKFLKARKWKQQLAQGSSLK